MQSVAVIIPVFNEESVVRHVIHGVYREGFTHIVVVDDGSTDATFQEVSKTKAVLLHHSINRGKGAAIKTGIEAVRLMGYRSIVTFDGDGQHDPKDIRKLIRYIYKGYDVVLGSRFLHNQSVPIVKRMMNYCANILMYILYGISVTDSQSGLRAYSKQAYVSLDTKSSRYEFDSEVIREIAQKRLSYIEIPMNVRYTKYSQEKETRQRISSALSSLARIIFVS